MNIFVDRKRPAFWIVLVVAVIVIAVIIGLGADTDQSGGVVDPDLRYKSEVLGISLAFPSGWENRYTVKESGEQIFVYSKKVTETFPEGGQLFSIRRQVGELITGEDVEQSATPESILLQGNGYTYFIDLPSDVQYPVDDQALTKEYQELSAQVTQITKKTKLLGEQRPVASNEGYQVVGTSFFTVEIPEKWKLSANEEDPASWDIENEKDVIGSISLVAYPHDPSVEDTLEKTNQYWEYVSDDQISREIMIRTIRSNKNVNAVKIMKSTLAFADGPYNMIDFQTEVAKYLKNGGEKIFGQIVDFYVKEKKPTTLKVCLLEFITGEEAADEPNGFLIKDTGKRRYYQFDEGCRILPLAAPDYNRYGLYEMPLLESEFLAENPNYNERYYDFFIGSDGKIKSIVEHYIP